MANEEPIHPSSTNETPITSPPNKMLGDTPVVSTYMGAFSSPNPSSEGKKAYLVEVQDG